ncbi:uncharacterized protein LODBEIA_P42230 [Lodderomyces beijingensis]|uniref:Uncharacterized protein n=1 Tax=Lodderomyces beijingensis TaxID=1775926 RepID=A0ABP0ZPC1_9ASCO
MTPTSTIGTNGLLYYLLRLVLVWIASWYLVYLVTGFHLQTITINNGISFNGITVKTKKLQIKIRSLRFRLWGNSKLTIVDELSVKLYPRDKPKKTDTKTKTTSTTENKCDGSSEQNSSGGSSNDSHICLFPQRRILKSIVGLLLRNFPKVDLELRNTNIISAFNYTTTIQYLRFDLSSRKSRRHEDKIKFNTGLSVNEVSHKIVPGDQDRIPFQLGAFRLDIKFSIDKRSGVLDSLIGKVTISDAYVSAFNAIKYYLWHDELKQEDASAEAETETETEAEADQEPSGEGKRRKGKLDKLEKTLRYLYYLVSDITIHLENAKISELPFVLINDNLSIKEYYKKSRPKTSLEFFAKSSSFNLTRIFEDAAGFQVLFNPKTDHPFHWTCTVQLVKFFFVRRVKLPTGHFGHETDEILNIPNLSYTHKTNLFGQLVRDQGFKNCVMETYFSASTPIFDIDAWQLSAILYNLVLLKKWTQLKKLRKSSGNGKEVSANSRGIDSTGKDQQQKPPTEVESLKEKIWNYVYEYYPRLDIKVVVEQPRLVLRHHVPGKNTQILSFSYSLLNFNLSTTESRDYSSVFGILYPSILYHEKSALDAPDFNNEIIKKYIAKSDYFNIKLDIFKNLTLKASVELNKTFINLTNFEIFKGIHSLLMDVTKLSETDLQIGVINKAFNEEIDSIREKLKRRVSSGQQHAGASESVKNTTLEEKLFKYLPSWVTQIDVKIDSFDALIGARSVLIPTADLFRSNSPENILDYDTDKNKDLRKVNWRFKSYTTTILNHAASSLLRKRSPSMSSHDSEESSKLSDSSETLTSLHENSYWSVYSNLKELQLLMPDDNSEKHSATIPFFEIPSVEFTVNSLSTSNDQNQLVLNADMDKVDVNFNMYKLFTLVGSIYLIREFIISPLKLIKSKVRKDMKKFDNDDVGGETPKLQQAAPSKSLLDFLLLNFTLNNSDFNLKLSEDFTLRLQFSDLQIDLAHKRAKLALFFIRLLANSPIVEHKWCRLLCLDSLAVGADIPQVRDDLVINVSTDAIRLIQPHNFVVYKLFQNVSIVQKSAKHLIKLLQAGDDKEGANVVHPHAQNPVPLPAIKIKSRHLKFAMEDDPFETELNMIYQLGLVEQRKRLDLYDIFEAREKQRGDSKDYFDKLNRLQITIARSWIRKVHTYQQKLRQEVTAHKCYLFGNETRFDSDYNKDVVAYPYRAPLLTIGFEDLNLEIERPQFGLDHVADFIHDIGQGVPKDTVYSLCVPMLMNLKVAEMRMQLRDYPLPLFHSPRSKDPLSPSLSLTGPLIITEQMVTADENLNKMEIPLVPVKDEDKDKDLNRFDSLLVEKTMSSVKLYTNLRCHFDSDYPTRIVWGTSYQFGIQQFMLKFDSFSKPPLDPSPKLGFWDKLKYILHGYCSIKTRTSLEVGFKGSRDPYDLLGTSTGFVLCFENNVIWDINRDDDPRTFFDIHAEKASWYIPNYLGAPLLAWTRNSLDSVYLPDSPNFISSCFAYYLDDSTTKPDLDRLKDVFAKDCISLSGGIRYTVGFLLQRKVDGKRVDYFKPHYQVQLMNPDFCQEGHHDSYEGFRSQYIHMAISLTADHENTYNTIHLSPGAFTHYFAWWKMFAGNMMLPIRRGPIFGETKNSVKFSQHLFTNKFSFYLKSLFISHIYRDEIVDVDKDRIECVGLRARVDEFTVDLHQRKQPVTLYHETLSKSSKVLKMVFNIGEVSLAGIDMRVVHTTFSQNFYSQRGDKYDVNKQSKYNIFGGDKQWFDIRDYEEAFLPSVKECPRTVVIYPLGYSRKFTYQRDTEDDSSHLENEDPFGNEDIHFCRLNTSNPVEVRIGILKQRLAALEQHISKVKAKKGRSIITTQLEERANFLQREIHGVTKEQKILFKRTPTMASIEPNEHFHNKFSWLSMQLKWNIKCRDLILKYSHFVQLKSNLRKYLSHDSISMLDKVIDKANKMAESDSSSHETSDQMAIVGDANVFKSKTKSEERSSGERFKAFNKILKEVNKAESLAEDYFIEIVGPQIQLQSDEAPDSVVIISAPSISTKIVSILDSKDEASADVLEKRYGNVLRKANVFVLNKKDVLESDNFITVEHPYGAESNWPPWLGAEITDNGEWAGENQLLIKNMSVMALLYETEVLGSKLAKMNNDAGGGATTDNSTTTPSHGGESGLNNAKGLEAPRRLKIDMPSIILTSTSTQYFTLYMIVISLLFYSEPMSKFIKDKIEKMKFSIDFDNIHSISEQIRQMQAYYHVLRRLTTNYSFRAGHLNNEALNEYLQINLQSADTASDVYLMLRTLFTGDFFDDASNNPQMSWLIRADELILHILEDDRTPILDLAMADGVYERKELESGSNINKIQIGMMQGFNLIKNARYPDFISPFDLGKDQLKNLVDLEWTMNRSVGGIKIVENIQLNSLPLNIKIDEITGKKLLKFIFQSDSLDIRESKVMKLTNNTQAKKEKIEDSSDKEDEFGFMLETQGANKSSKLDKGLKQEQQSSTQSSQRKSRLNLTKVSDKQPSTIKDPQDDDEQIDEMVERSKKYFSVISLVIRAITLRITIRLNKGFRRILNVNNFKLDLPELIIRNRIISFVDLTDMMKRIIIKTLMSHLGKLISNKFQSSADDPDADLGSLRQIKHYDKFTPIKALTVADSFTASPTAPATPSPRS